MIILQRLFPTIALILTLFVSGFIGFAYADDVHLTKAEIKALYSKVQSCWALSPELTKDKSLAVMVQINLDKSGKVTGNIKAKASGGSAANQSEMAASAKRAVIGCQPYKLPIEKYQSWSKIEFHFSTADM